MSSCGSCVGAFFDLGLEMPMIRIGWGESVKQTFAVSGALAPSRLEKKKRLGFRDIYFPKSSSSRTIAKRWSCKPLGSTILPFVLVSVVFAWKVSTCCTAAHCCWWLFCGSTCLKGVKDQFDRVAMQHSEAVVSTANSQREGCGFHSHPGACCEEFTCPLCVFMDFGWRSLDCVCRL